MIRLTKHPIKWQKKISIIVGAEELFIVKKISSFVITNIKNLGKDEIELYALVDSKPDSFVIAFTKDKGGNYLGFIFRSDLEMLCRANELIFVRSLMDFLQDYRDGHKIALPFFIPTQSQHLQAA